MTSTERHEARYQRRKAERAAKRQSKLSQFDDFERVADFDNLYMSFLKSMSGVSWKESVQRYEANAMRNISETRRKLLAGESVQSGFVEFLLHERGKIRNIKSVHISERVVQKCLCDQVLVPLLSNSLIYDNGASIKGKGVHFAIKRFIAHLSRFYRNNGHSNEGYALVIDFKKFFDNVDHRILFYLMGKKIKDRRVQALIKKFITVFGEGKSLGLGSQVSQICAIFYPDMLDHYIKETLRIKYYGRYMDDLYLIHADKEYLKHCLEGIQRICDKLKITINTRKTRIVKLSQEVDFLKGKYTLLSSGKILRRPCKDSTTRMRRKLKKFKALIDAKKMRHSDLRTSYQSWRGNYKRRFNAYHRVRNMDKLYYDLFISNHTNSTGR
jgi:hypothetical protein